MFLFFFEEPIAFSKDNLQKTIHLASVFSQQQTKTRYIFNNEDLVHIHTNPRPNTLLPLSIQLIVCQLCREKSGTVSDTSTFQKSFFAEGEQEG